MNKSLVQHSRETLITMLVKNNCMLKTKKGTPKVSKR